MMMSNSAAATAATTARALGKIAKSHARIDQLCGSGVRNPG
jgi:hypothetical protein